MSGVLEYIDNISFTLPTTIGYPALLLTLSFDFSGLCVSKTKSKVHCNIAFTSAKYVVCVYGSLKQHFFEFNSNKEKVFSDVLFTFFSKK